MKRLLIKNFGPIKEANLTLGQVNIITGMQSSGKSCVLKTACYCSWVEKRLELTQKSMALARAVRLLTLWQTTIKWQAISKIIPTLNMKPAI